MTDTANLEDGFYWVRLTDGLPWEVALVDAKCRIARLHGSLNYWDLRELHEIDPRPIKREDVK